jgi:DNA polymerase
LELFDVYKVLLEEVKNHLKYNNEEYSDFKFDKTDERFKFIIKKEFDKTLKNSEPNELSVEEELILLENKVAKCRKCPLYSTRNNTVFGYGNINADIMFIGEGPGENEDLQGIPFVGKAGNLLTDIIEKGMKLKREDVYLANIVKCRPPGNRDPKSLEVSSCIGYLHKQIRLIKPKIIVALGRVALSSLLPAYSSIRRHRGKELTLYLSQNEAYKVIPTYHPSYLLRGTDKEIYQKKREVWQDIKKVMKLLNIPF